MKPAPKKTEKSNIKLKVPRFSGAKCLFVLNKYCTVDLPVLLWFQVHSRLPKPDFRTSNHPNHPTVVGTSLNKRHKVGRFPWTFSDSSGPRLPSLHPSIPPGLVGRHGFHGALEPEKWVKLGVSLNGGTPHLPAQHDHF